MKINSKVIEITEEFGIDFNDAFPYLLSLHFGYTPSYIPDVLKQKMNLTHIFDREPSGIIWNIPLFENSNVNSPWDWVNEDYISLFAKIGKGTNKRESAARMKRLFASDPTIRKDEVIGATELYLQNTDPKFARLPHYFIEKGSGGNKTQDILDWIDQYRESQLDINRGTSRRLK